MQNLSPLFPTYDVRCIFQTAELSGLEIIYLLPVCTVNTLINNLADQNN